jgi:hypothetical protein
MSTLTSLAAGYTAGRTAGSVPYLVDVNIDFAAAATEKGTTLAAADIIECINVPANTLILNAGIEVITATGGESSDTTYDLGVTTTEPDNFVDGFDGDAAAAGAYAQNAAAYQPLVIGSAADTIDLLIATATTAPTSGVFRVWAVLMDIDGRIGAASVDREQLA